MTAEGHVQGGRPLKPSEFPEGRIRDLVTLMVEARLTLTAVCRAAPDIFGDTKRFSRTLKMQTLMTRAEDALLQMCATALERSADDLRIGLSPPPAAVAAKPRVDIAPIPQRASTEDTLEWALEALWASLADRTQEVADVLVDRPVAVAVPVLAELGVRDPDVVAALLRAISGETGESANAAWDLFDALEATKPKVASIVRMTVGFRALAPRHVPAPAEVALVQTPLRELDPTLGRAMRLANMVRRGDAAAAAAEILSATDPAATGSGRVDYDRIRVRLGRPSSLATLLLAIGHTGSDGGGLLTDLLPALLECDKQLGYQIVCKLLESDPAKSDVVDTAIAGIAGLPAARTNAAVYLLHALSGDTDAQEALERYVTSLEAAGLLAAVLTAVAPYATRALAAGAFEHAADCARLIRDLVDLDLRVTVRLFALALDQWERVDADLADSHASTRTFVRLCCSLVEPYLSRLAAVLSELITSHVSSAATFLYALEFEDRGRFGALLLTKAIDSDNTLGGQLGALIRVGTPPPARIFERLATHWPGPTQVLTSGLTHVSAADSKILALELVTEAPTFVLSVAEHLRDVEESSRWAYIASAILDDDLVGARVAIELEVTEGGRVG